jgi:hypothetical protein
VGTQQLETWGKKQYRIDDVGHSSLRGIREGRGWIVHATVGLEHRGTNCGLSRMPRLR